MQSGAGTGRAEQQIRCVRDMRDIEQLQRQHTEPATEAVVSECFMHSLYSFGIWPGEIMWQFACVKNGCAILYYFYIVWHDKQIYIQHFKIMKNVQPGHLHFPLPLVIVVAKEGRI